MCTATSRQRSGRDGRKSLKIEIEELKIKTTEQQQVQLRQVSLFILILFEDVSFSLFLCMQSLILNPILCRLLVLSFIILVALGVYVMGRLA